MADRPNTANVLGAGATGGALGTTIAALAENMPANSDYRSQLIILAPMIAVALSSAWLFLKQVYIDPLANKKKMDASNDQMKTYLEQAKKTLADVLSDESSTEEHRTEARKIVEELERMQLENIASRMKVAVAQ